MRDTDQVVAFRSALLPVLPAGTEFLQGWQPTSVAQPAGPTITMFKVADVDYGSPGREDVWDEPAGLFIHREVQHRETTWQINAIVPSIDLAEGMAALTPGDLLRLLRMHLRSDAVMAQLMAAGVSILRPRDIRNVPVEGDGGQPEQNPSFDVIVRHSDILTATTPVVTSTVTHIERV